MPRRVPSEAIVHQQVCDYLRRRHPGTIWRTDFAAGLKLPPAVAIRHARHQSSRAFPDLFIFEPSHVLYGDYHGLFLELKRPDVTVYKKDGTLRADPHLQEQAAMHDELRRRGFAGGFAIGFDDAVRQISEYLTGGSPLF